MKIYLIEVETDVGAVKLPARIEVEAIAEVMPVDFRELTERLWAKTRLRAGATMIKWIEVDTDAGRRVVKLAAPIEVDATVEVMPRHFRDLTEILWNVVREFARQPPQVPKVQA